MRIFLSLMFIFLSTTQSFAYLTAGKIAVTKTSSSANVSSTSQDSDISDTVSSSVSIGVPLSVPSGITANLTGNATTATTATSANSAGTAITATGTAQPNITSLGTLSTLLVSGNIGVGSTAPGMQLDVNGTVRASQNVISSGQVSANNFNSTGSTTPSNGFTQTAANTLGFFTGSVRALTIDSNQNVGIGTAIPNVKFQVNGTINQLVPNGTGNNLELNQAGTNGWSIATEPTTDDFYLYNGTTTTPSFYIQESSGNVGINTTNPVQGLDVEGTLRIKDVGIGTSIPQELCRKSDGTFGYYNGAWAGVCS